MSTYLCPEGHETVYQSLSGGRSWYCETCDDMGDYDYSSMPEAQRPRAWLLTQPGGADKLREQMAEHLGQRWYCTHPTERAWSPGDSRVLPEADMCDHEECKPSTTSEVSGGC